MKSKILFLLILFLKTLSATAQIVTVTAWTLNDVTYIYPLPQNPFENDLLPLQNLIPAKIIAELPKLSVRYDKDQLTKMTRVLAMRIDPENLQVRLVWQPLQYGPQNKVFTVDAAFHSFYQLQKKDFANFIIDLQNWKITFKTASLTEQSALNIHPALLNDSTNKALKSLNALILRYCDRQNLAKVTTMVLRGADNMWAFLGYDVTHSGEEVILQPVKIPRLKEAQVQRFINQAVPFKFYDGAEIEPHTNDSDDLTNILQQATPETTLTESEVFKILNVSHRFENPKIFSADNLDCVSCHVAQGSREWSLKFNSLAVKINENQYQNPRYNLANYSTEIFNTGQIRGLGYFGENLAISQRVIHESAEAADFLNLNNFFKR